MIRTAVHIYEVKAKRILNKTKIPGIDWSINHYSGCMHGCVYCYARFICRWRKKREKWGTFVDVKVNAPELIAKESKNKAGKVVLCTGSDPYQPIERKYRLTERVLQNLNPYMELSILTKSDLILRDIDLFKRFKKHELGVTITTLDESVKKAFEPHSPGSHARLNALKELKEKGFRTFCFVGPVLPYLTNLEEMFREISPFVDIFRFEDLNISVARKEIFEAIKTNFPELEERYRSLSSEFWLAKEKEIKRLSKKYDKPVEIYFKHTGSLRFEY